MSKVLSLRVSDELAAWADEYAKGRGVPRQALLESAIESFREDCERGVPELRELAKRQSTVSEPARGVGDCPKRDGDLGHVWKSWKVDPVRSCEFCGMPGRGEGGYFESATTDRVELFSRLRLPKSDSGIIGKGKPPKDAA